MTRATGFWRCVLAPIAALVLLASAVAAPAFAQAPKRVALVIGNGAYATAGALSNARNDMTLVSGALKRAGFTTVTTRTDLSTQAFQLASDDAIQLPRAS